MFWNQLKTITLLGALSVLVIGIGAAVAPGHLVFFVALAVAMNAGAYFFSDRIVLAMSRAHEVPREQAPGLHGIVEELARAAGIPKPRVFVVDDPQPNAFATGRNPRYGVVAVTSGILELLDARELRGVLAHEIAHIKHRDILVASLAAAGASVVTYIAHALSFGMLLGGAQGDEESEGSPAGGLLFALVAPIGATLVQLAISRSREYMADELGARLSGDPLALAGALRKLSHGAELVPGRAEPATASLYIVNPFTGSGGLASLFSTHPPMAERVRRLEELALTAGRWRARPVSFGRAARLSRGVLG